MKQKKSFEIRDWHIYAVIILVITGLVTLARFAFNLFASLCKLL